MTINESCEGEIMEGGMLNREELKNYYGKIIQSTQDLKTKACCCDGEPMSPAIKKILGAIDGEILSRSYGCGSPIPEALEGCTVLDLGCGSGRDVYLVSKLVGPNGFVIGVDMTEEQLETAKEHVASQMKSFGFATPNVDFRSGYIENLKELNIEDNSIDVVISNCVINLSPDKMAVFSEIFRVLKPGGEVYFADVFAGRRIPDHLKEDPVLHGECLAGAMYIEDFRRLLHELGCRDYRITTKRMIDLESPESEAKIGMVDFYSMTVRAFKLANLEDICEDYGQVATYAGTIPDHPHYFDLDDHHLFYTGKPMLVCGNTAAMLQETRFGEHFKVAGDRVNHYGPFDCGPASSKQAKEDFCAGGVCC